MPFLDGAFGRRRGLKGRLRPNRRESYGEASAEPEGSGNACVAGLGRASARRRHVRRTRLPGHHGDGFGRRRGGHQRTAHDGTVSADLERANRPQSKGSGSSGEGLGSRRSTGRGFGPGWTVRASFGWLRTGAAAHRTYDRETGRAGGSRRTNPEGEASAKPEGRGNGREVGTTRPRRSSRRPQRERPPHGGYRQRGLGSGKRMA